MFKEKGLTAIAKDIKEWNQKKELSLCGYCGCMTYTINDKCGKCNVYKER